MNPGLRRRTRVRRREARRIPGNIAAAHQPQSTQSPQRSISLRSLRSPRSTYVNYMDNVTHTLFALTLARTPLGRGRGTTAALVLASNAPDVDVVATLGGAAEYLRWHRGPTHGPLGVIGLGLVTAGLVWGARRLIERRANGRAPRMTVAGQRAGSGGNDADAVAPFATLLFASLAGVLAHILMDLPTLVRHADVEPVQLAMVRDRPDANHRRVSVGHSGGRPRRWLPGLPGLPGCPGLQGLHPLPGLPMARDAQTRGRRRARADGGQLRRSRRGPPGGVVDCVAALRFHLAGAVRRVGCIRVAVRLVATTRRTPDPPGPLPDGYERRARFSVAVRMADHRATTGRLRRIPHQRLRRATAERGCIRAIPE